jgi:hypothetical protein
MGAFKDGMKVGVLAEFLLVGVGLLVGAVVGGAAVLATRR